MKFSRLAGLMAGLLAILGWVGCGNTYRPVVNPSIPNTGTPQTTRFAMAVFQPDASCVNASGQTCPGASQQIDVSGDSAVATVFIGQTNASSRVVLGSEGFVSNTADGTVSAFALSSPGVTANTINFLSGAAPTGMVVANSQVYVIDSGLAANEGVTVLSPSTNTIVAQLPAGATTAHPLALAATPDGSQVYVANDDGTVSVISTADNTVSAPVAIATSACASTSSPPCSASLMSNSSGSSMYVLFQPTSLASTNSVLSVINTFVPITVTASLSEAGVQFMAYDPHLQRVYVAVAPTGTVAGSITAIDVSNPTPSSLNALQPTISGLGNPKALAVSTDGSSVYAINSGASGACPGGVAVLNANALTFSGVCIQLPPGQAPQGVPADSTLVGIATAGNGSRLYVAHDDSSAPGISVIDSTTNSFVLDIAAPTDENCTPSSTPPIVKCFMHPVYLMSQ